MVEMKHMVMSSIYTDYFHRNGIQYDIVYLDRYNLEENSKAQTIYRCICSKYGFWSKIYGYIKFKLYAQQILQKNKYDFVVVWNEYTSVLFSHYLVKHYHQKYSVNIRDLFNEKSIIRNPKILNPLLKQAIKNSLFVTVSSGKYIDYLPKYNNYHFIHSINSEILPKAKLYSVQGNIKPIKILYIGKIGYLNEVKRLIDCLKNDDRFLMKFVGIGSEIVKTYADDCGCKNVEFVGSFERQKTLEYLNEADIIYNLYNPTNACERTALSNKLYYAVCLNVPILVFKNTYMYEIAEECGIAFAVDGRFDNSLGNELYRWFEQFDRKSAQKKCESFLTKAKESKIIFYNYLDNKLLKEKK
ncbi:MAG: hypothetical protein PHY15_02365 [Eubacteriales bacterium]|nr:hypothetical protein [Eubacteriales bacterium]MDD4474330.1 hypothetical protein [Eubacteriales bacterium]